MSKPGNAKAATAEFLKVDVDKQLVGSWILMQLTNDAEAFRQNFREINSFHELFFSFIYQVCENCNLRITDCYQNTLNASERHV